MTEAEIREIEKQLSCPSGENGIDVGNRMNELNIDVTKNSIRLLGLKDDDSVLELGHGNCGHLQLILGASNRIKYYGLEVSETMWKEAQKKNPNEQAEFKLYDGQIIPYPDNYFNRILTVNTIYFWSNPEGLISEIERTLKPNGIFILTYADKSFMRSLPFVGEKFKLFDKNDIHKLVEKSNLKIKNFQDEEDEIESKIGDKVSRKYTICILENTLPC